MSPAGAAQSQPPPHCRISQRRFTSAATPGLCSFFIDQMLAQRTLLAIDNSVAEIENQPMTRNEHMSLEQLEQDVWPEPDFNSRLVTACHTLRKKRLCDFSVEDLRIMIGQGVGLEYLLPKAIDILENNPLSEGDFYEGDLLVAVAGSAEQAILYRQPFKDVLIEVCRSALNSSAPTLSKSDHRKVKELLSRLQQSGSH